MATDERARAYLFETMAARLTEVMMFTVEISVSRMDARLASLLLRLVDLHRSRTIRLTHDELAAELGTAREVVSRLYDGVLEILQFSQRIGVLVLIQFDGGRVKLR